MKKKVLPNAESRHRLGDISRSKFYRLQKNDPRFPRLVKIGNTRGLLEEDLEAYIIACQQVRDEVAE